MLKFKVVIIFCFLIFNHKSLGQIFKHDSLIKEGDISELIRFPDSLNWVSGVIQSKVFPDSIRIVLPKSKLEYLDIWSSDLEVIPNEIGEVKSLKYLSIGGRFNQLPNNINQLQNLQTLVIPNSMLTSFKIKSPPNLQVLTIVTDTTIDFNTKFSQSLNYLMISSTQVKLDLECLCNLKNLIYLQIYSLQTPEIPKCFGKLKKLEFIGISTELNEKNTKTLSKLNHIKFIVFNRMDTLPHNLIKLSFLQGISFGKILTEDNAVEVKKYLPATKILNSKELKDVSDSYYFKYHE